MDEGVLRDQFARKQGVYEQTAQRVAQKVKSSLLNQQVPIHAVTHRVKTFESFYTKAIRKGYSKPFEQCEDIAGVRVVCPFSEHVSSAIKVIQETFKIVSQTRKKKHIDQFSYTGQHFIVLDGELCEIQVRTILQDAWAGLEHYMNYKQLGLDEEEKRRVNALSAIFELAEGQFAQIQSSHNKESVSAQDSVTPARIYQFCKLRYPWAWEHLDMHGQIESEAEYAAVAARAKQLGLTTMAEFERCVNGHEPKVSSQEAYRVKEILNSPGQWPKLYVHVKKTNHFYAPATFVMMCLQN
ncbi:MAG TPA: hypothetical protein VK158_00945 [Acidobacteriota bacterium]|nr:hypothetical protein [Acidobacteriota bacterium]